VLNEAKYFEICVFRTGRYTPNYNLREVP